MDKDLQYYLDHPEEVPTDPEVLAQLLNASATEPEPGEKQEDPPKPAETKKEEEAAVAGEGEEEAPILTRDGKHTIPYDVLKTERERRLSAEQASGELKAQIEAMQARIRDLEAGAARPGEAETQVVLEQDELEAIKADFPQLGGVIEKQTEIIARLNAKLEALGATTESVRKVQESAQERQAREERDTVQSLIDVNPVLAYLQSEKPELFDVACKVDETLRADTARDWSNVSARFEKVAETMSLLYGPFPVKKVSNADQAGKEGVQPSKQTEIEKAREAVREGLAAATSKAPPKTLTDVQGAAPEESEWKSLESMSPAEIGAKMMSMSNDQRAKYLNQLA